MSRKYKFKDQSRPYFISFAVVYWIDVFTRNQYREEMLESLKYCQQNKGLIIHAWCIMTNHVHLIIGTKGNKMEDIVRDFKSYTSRKMREAIQNNPSESRKEWMLWLMKRAGTKNKNNNGWQFWQQHNQPIELWDNYMIDQKLDYLHNNPVKEGFVSNPEDYVFSSAKDYTGQKGLLDVYLLE